MEEITISVSPEVAKAYESASDEQRQCIQTVVSFLLKEKSDSDIANLRATMDEMSDRAQKRGLTPEILESILSE